MPSLTKGVKVFKGSQFNFIAAIGALATIAALIFYPTWDSIFDSSTGSSESTNFSSRQISEDKAQDDFERAAEEELSPLALLAAQLEAGYYDNKGPHQGAVDEKGAQPADTGVAQVDFTWRDVRGGESLKALKRAKLETHRLLKQIEPFKLSSREWLAKYFALLKLIIKGGEDKLELVELRPTIQALDDQITSVFLEERVDRADLLKWVNINMGRLLEPDFEQRAKQSLEIDFTPRITLSSVKVWQEGKRYFGRGLVNDGLSRVTLRGYVYGKDIKYLELDRGTSKMKKVFIKGTPDRDGRRFFKVTWVDSRPLFTFRVMDPISGSFTEKSYSFHSRAQRFPWRNGYYQIPFRDMDPRLDGYFLVSQRGRGAESEGSSDVSVF